MRPCCTTLCTGPALSQPEMTATAAYAVLPGDHRHIPLAALFGMPIKAAVQDTLHLLMGGLLFNGLIQPA